MVSNYAHMKWAEELVATLKSSSDDPEFVGDILLGAIDHFKTLSPEEKSDVFVFLLGRWVKE